MALNPPQTNNGDPCRVEGEYFIMKRIGIEFEMKIENGSKYTAKGYMILTTARIVCVNKDDKSLFKCFDLPLSLISKESFEQPIFGSNYLYGFCKPLMNLLPGVIRYKIWFTEGGCGTFVPAFFNVLGNLRKNENKSPDSKFINMVSNGTFAKSAYIDPNDPSILYVEQPSTIQSTNNQKSNQSNTINITSKQQNVNTNNQKENLDLPNENEVLNNNQKYPNINDLTVNNPNFSSQNQPQQQQDQVKYFGYFGPNLTKNQN